MEFPLWLGSSRAQILSMRMQVLALAWLSVLGYSLAARCGIDHRSHSDPLLLQLWCRPAAATPIWPLACPFFFRFFFFFFFFFLGLPLQHVEVPRLWVELELQLLPYTTVTARTQLQLTRSSQQCWNLNLLSKARDRIHILMDTTQFLNPLSHNGNSPSLLLG